MRSFLRRAVMTATLVAGGGLILAGPNTGCLSYLAGSTAIATDFCFIFDCQNGLFGGTIRPCSQDGESGVGVPGGLFTDCLDEEGP